MNKNLSEFFKHQLILGTVVMVFMLSCWPIAAGAESAWLEKGKNLLIVLGVAKK